MADDRPTPDEKPTDERTSELISYLDGELKRERAEQIEVELGRDPKLRREADALKRTWDLLDFLPRPEPSSGFTQKTVSQIAPLEKLPPSGSSLTRTRAVAPSGELVPHSLPSRPRPRWPWAVAAVGCLLLGWVIQRPIQRTISPPPKEKQTDTQMLSELRLLKNLKYYREVETLEFLQALDQSDLFAEEPFARNEP